MRTNDPILLVLGLLLAACDGPSVPAADDVLPTTGSDTSAALADAVPSSNQECMCWPTGDKCSFPWADNPAIDSTKACPTGEQCTGSASSTQPGGKIVGYCRRPCVLDAEGASCAAGERCEAVKIVSPFEGMVVATPSLCVLDEYPGGSDQTAGQVPDKK